MIPNQGIVAQGPSHLHLAQIATAIIILVDSVRLSVCPNEMCILLLSTDTKAASSAALKGDLLTRLAHLTHQPPRLLDSRA